MTIMWRESNNDYYCVKILIMEETNNEILKVMIMILIMADKNENSNINENINE